MKVKLVYFLLANYILLRMKLNRLPTLVYAYGNYQ
nr:hypothetical protein [Mucilaginibacter sp. E4BP6]